MKLRSRLFQLVAGTVIPLLILATVFGLLLIQRERETLSKGALDRVRVSMTAVDTEIRGHFTTLDAMAASKNLEDDQLRAFYDEAVRVLKGQPDWLTVILSLPNGRQVINVLHPFGVLSLVNADMESTERLVTTLRPTVGNISLGPLAKSYAVPIRVPILRGGKLKYILSAAIKPKVFARLIEEQQLPPNWVMGLIDASGHFVARVPPLPPTESASKDFLAATARGKLGWYRGLTVEGKDTFTAHATSELSGWSIGLAMPAADVTGPATRAAWGMALGALLTAGFALGFAYWMGRRIATPIGELARAARTLGESRQPTTLETSAGIIEVRELAASFNDAARAIAERQSLIEREQVALKAADRSKDEFLAMLGHELRNPLGAITSASHVLRIAKPGDDRATQAHAIIERQTRQMTRLIDDLLDISRLAMGKVTLHREPFDLSDLVAHTVRTWEQSQRVGPERIRVDTRTVWVQADRARIEQVLANLLDNAVKFSPAHTVIHVVVREDDRHALLEVSDEGEGIAPDMLSRIFDLFVQGAHGPDRARGGMGVGLALVKRLVEMHGGTVSVASEGPGHGSRFTVRLLARPAASRTADTTSDSTSSQRGTRILVVEDQADARDMMRALLEFEGYDVRAVATGAEAIAETARWQPDVVLMDIGLPDMEGYEVARRLRFARDQKAKLIALTGYGQARDQQRAYEAGFDLHLTKPVSMELLREVLSPSWMRLGS